MIFLIFKQTKISSILSFFVLFISASANLFSFNPAPVSSISLSCPTDITVGIFGNSCSATIQLPMPQVQMSNCIGNPSFFVSSSFGVGLGPHQNVPAGTYKINYRAISPCGDTATCASYVHIEDKKKPVPVLVTALYTNLTSTGSVTVEAWQFNQNSYDNCSAKADIRFSFSQNPNDTLRVFKCTDLGMSNIAITVWDKSGNATVKITKIGVLDNDGYCFDNSLQGKVETGKGTGLSETKICIEGAGITVNMLTDEQGGFSLEDVDPAVTYRVKASKDDDYLNNVNAFDLYTLHQHLIGDDPFTEPSQFIAADINRDGKVSVSDLLLLQECILGLHQKFPTNTSWRFLDKNYVFSNILNPLVEPFPEDAVINPADGVRYAHFLAIKIGDTDMGTSLLNRPTEDRTKEKLTIAVTHIADNKLALKLDIPQDTKAFDGTIHLEDLPFRFSAVESNNPSLQTALFSNNLKFSWYHDGAQLLESIIFLTITPTASVFASEGYFSLNETQTTDLGNESVMYQATVNFNPNPSANLAAPSALRAFPNSPNPFMEFTMLPFSTECNADVLVRIFDAAGQVVHEIPETHYEAGEHRILLMRNALNEPGIYTCRFESKIGTAIRKLMLL